MRIGTTLHINNNAAAGMVATLANNISDVRHDESDGRSRQSPERGFRGQCGFYFGDHLGFTANMPGMIFAVIVGKLVGGVTALGVAVLIAPKRNVKSDSVKAEEDISVV